MITLQAVAALASLVSIPPTAYDITDALTGVKVRVSIGEFRISDTEVTQREFLDVMGYNPSHHRGDDLPVENVTWWEAIRYANQLSVKEGLRSCYNLSTGERDRACTGYRLPTDAEWTYAAAGSPPESANLGSKDTKSVERLTAALRQSGTRPVRASSPNQNGLYDMYGNVWEWCDDWFNPADTPQSALDPGGALHGVARILRGGSFISTRSNWARGYRSSMDPGYKSRFTGFRVARTVRPAAPEPSGADWFEPYQRVPAGFENATGGLAPLPAAEWEQRRASIREKWAALLGAPSTPPPVPAVRVVETVREQNYIGRLMYLQVEPDFWEKIYLMTPDPGAARPRPVVIVPYYDVDTPAGANLGGRNFLPPSVRSFAYMAVQQGWMAAAIRWFGESYGERYDEAVANLKLKHPACSGLGKWVWDAQRLVDYLHTLPEVDRAHIGIIGHSLGAKMSLYAAAMDDRISAVVFSEGGIGLSFSNYDDYWYFGDHIRKIVRATDHHELLGLIAPRPFLLIAGDSADGDKSWHYINAARPVYQHFGRPRHLGLFNHRSGHTPTPESVQLGIEWLKRFLGPSGR